METTFDNMLFPYQKLSEKLKINNICNEYIKYFIIIKHFINYSVS